MQPVMSLHNTAVKIRTRDFLENNMSDDFDSFDDDFQPEKKTDFGKLVRARYVAGKLAGKRFKAFLAGLFPITKRRHQREIDANIQLHLSQLRSINASNAKELEESRRQVKDIVEKATTIHFDRPQSRPEMYVVSVQFDPRMFGAGYLDRQQMEMVGATIGRQVQYEISSCRFIQSANQAEEQRLRMWPPMDMNATDFTKPR